MSTVSFVDLYDLAEKNLRHSFCKLFDQTELTEFWCEGVTPHKNFDLFLFIDYFIPEILSWLMMTSEVGLVRVCFVGMACFACHDCSW